MSTITAADEHAHLRFPCDRAKPWKENWYFNFIDREHDAWGINHISLERHNQKARFSAFHIVDGEVLLYANEIPIEDTFAKTTDGNLSVEILEPMKRFRVSFTGPGHSVDLIYDARFDVFDYANEHQVGEDGSLPDFAIEHYEQALTVSGTLTKSGATRAISCLGHRDHSWGFRDESLIAGWNWVAVQFPDKTFNFSEVRLDGGGSPLRRGFVSEAAGNTGIRDVRVVSTERGADGVPTSSTFEAVDEKGRAWTFVSQRFSGLVLPLSGRGRPVVIYENFADYTLVQTGERGVGIDEVLADLP